MEFASHSTPDRRTSGGAPAPGRYSIGSSSGKKKGNDRRIALPDLDEPDLSRFYSILLAHRDDLLVKKVSDEKDEVDCYLLMAVDFGDWALDSGKIPKKAFWKGLNAKLGNLDYSLPSLQQMLAVIGFTPEEAAALDMKGVEMYSALVIRRIRSSGKWDRFNSNLEGRCRLENDLPICGKLRHLAAERADAVHVLCKASGRIDLVGGKATLGEYREFLDGRNHAALVKSAIREALEELSLRFLGGEGELPEPQVVDGMLQTGLMRCAREDTQGQLLVGLQFVQLAPFLLKILVLD